MNCSAVRVATTKIGRGTRINSRNGRGYDTSDSFTEKDAPEKEANRGHLYKISSAHQPMTLCLVSNKNVGVREGILLGLPLANSDIHGPSWASPIACHNGNGTRNYFCC